jgi:hypothetical protein
VGVRSNGGSWEVLIRARSRKRFLENLRYLRPIHFEILNIMISSLSSAPCHGRIILQLRIRVINTHSLTHSMYDLHTAQMWVQRACKPFRRHSKSAFGPRN